jgi:hypothetical protein
MPMSMFKQYLFLLATLLPFAAYAQSNRAYSPVLVLNQLHAFQQKHGYDGFNPGFSLIAFDDDSQLSGWSRDPQFLRALYPFARANGGRSFYAIWQMSPGQNLSRSPVVLFGDDGTEHVVARNARELISLVTLETDTEDDAEPDEDFSAFTRPGSGYSPYRTHSNFAAWVEQNSPRVHNNDPEAGNEIIIKRAQQQYEPAFKRWKVKYLNRKP